MGRTLTRIASETSGIEIVGGLESRDSPQVGSDMGELAGIGNLGVKVSNDPAPLLAEVDGVIDFTVPAATVGLSEIAAQRRLVHVIGTTGLSEVDEGKIRAAARHARIVKSGNMSVGVNLLAALVEKVARTLPIDFDIEILEMHHRHKVDAPSGTALLFGQAAAAGRNIELKEKAIRGRDGQTGARPRGHIGFGSLRGGSVVGEHSVIFAGPSERIEFVHRAESRDIFAHGAMRAALWAEDKQPGLYSIADVMGLAE
jgi:4-hydroxy-tetrahydrodipicolinate reductase